MAFVLTTAPDGTEVWVDEDTNRSVTQDPAKPTQNSWAETIRAGLNAVQTFQLNQINVERAKLGLPPIDTSAYTGMGVRVGLAPQTQQLLIYGGLALLAVMVFNTLAKRR